MTASVAPLLTDTQQKILTAIRGFFTVHGYPPALRDIADACHLSPSTVQYQVGQLALKGWIRRAAGVSRGLVVLNPDDGTDT